MIFGQLFEAGGQSQFVHRPQRGVDDAEHEVDPEALAYDAGTEPAKRRGVGEVHVAMFFEPQKLLLVQKVACEAFGIFGRKAGG